MKKILLILGGVLLLAAIVAMNFMGKRGAAGKEVFTEKIARRDLEAMVRESGKVRAKTSVPISAQVVGQVREVCAREGERVSAGAVLIHLDPTPIETAIAQAEVAVADAEKRLDITRTNLERTKKKLEREQGLSTTSRERVDELKADIDVQTKEVQAAELRVTGDKSRLERERHELTKVRITAPIDGVVVRVNVEKGQNVVMGAMNSGGTELMTVADLSVLQIELEVGEAAILDVKPGQEARAEIDALPNRKLKGKVTEVGTSPLPAAPGQDRGVSFKVVVTLDETVEGVRPGFSASAEIVTATRAKALALPIKALVARELAVDDKEQIVPLLPPGSANGAAVSTKKKIFEGVVVVKDGRAHFVPVKVGISGKEHFELLEGPAEGQEIVSGPYKSLRDMKDDDLLERKEEK